MLLSQAIIQADVFAVWAVGRPAPVAVPEEEQPVHPPHPPVHPPPPHPIPPIEPPEPNPAGGLSVPFEDLHQ